MKINHKVEEELDIVKSNDDTTVTSIKINDTTFEIAQNVLILKRASNSYKEKILIDLGCITSTKVVKHSNIWALFFSLFFLVIGGGATYPLYRYFSWWGFASLGGGVLIFIILFTIYFLSRNIRIVIYRLNGEPIRRTCREVNKFNKINAFFDEIFYRKYK
jgi:hypothetical protein